MRLEVGEVVGENLTNKERIERIVVGLMRISKMGSRAHFSSMSKDFSACIESEQNRPSNPT